MSMINRKSGVVMALSAVFALSHAPAHANISQQGQMYMQIQQLQQEVATLRGMLEEQQNQIQQLSRDSTERYAQLEQRLSLPLEPVAAPAPAASSSTSITAAPITPASEPGDPAREQEFYDAAFSLIRKREFDTAEQAFSAFLRRYPNGQLSANAHYWLGEISLVQNDYQAAGKSFATVIQHWPEHSKVPDSMYKLANVELRLGNKDRAKTILQQVIQQYPSSSAARLAQQDIQQI